MKEKKDIILSKDLEHVLRGFTPVLGNLEDLSIVHSLKRLKVKLKSINNVALREAISKRSPLAGRMREIHQEEINLVNRIHKRNLDL